MKVFVLCLLMMLLPAARAQQSYEEGYLRLHVIANSNSAEDQEAKLLARDAVLKEIQPLLADCSSAEEAYQRTEKCLALWTETASQASNCTARAEMGIFPFPDRLYGDRLVPAGDYLALRIILGDGNGENWWCVLYPGMCMPDGWEMEPQWKRILAQWCIWKGV